MKTIDDLINELSQDDLERIHQICPFPNLSGISICEVYRGTDKCRECRDLIKGLENSTHS